ncbi:MAG: CDP-archaeol synthase [Akkermansia sp.]|nr:CDP-archaeol synthase [Akkermansia sp.]
MSPKIKTLLERGFSTIVLLSLLGGTVAWNEPIGYAGLICVLCNLTSWEWFNMLKGTNANRVLSLVCGLIYPWLLAAICLMPTYGTGAETMIELLDGGISVALGFLVLYTLLAFCGQLFRMDYRGKTGAEVLDGMGMTLLSFVYPVWMFSFALLCVDVEATIWTMLWIVLFTKMSDIWAYVSGILLGGKFITRKFSPSVSPKKTWEGIIGSIIITLTVGAILLPALGLMTWEEISTPSFLITYIPLGLLLFFLSVWGDLAGSLIKRGLAVKDSGSLLPGIGGIFDLIDSPAFTVSAAICVAPIIAKVVVMMSMLCC